MKIVVGENRGGGIFKGKWPFMNFYERTTTATSIKIRANIKISKIFFTSATIFSIKILS